MINIIGWDKRKSKNTEKEYYIVFFSYPDSIDHGLKTGDAICSPDYFEKVKANPEGTKVGYDRERKNLFLYVK